MTLSALLALLARVAYPLAFQAEANKTGTGTATGVGGGGG
jgi:hypothetical protein